MTQKPVPSVAAPLAPMREPRPFLYLDPLPLDAEPPVLDSRGCDALEVAAGCDVPTLVRGLVNFTIAQQNGRALETGRRHEMPISVLNRRRRSARAWIMAILSAMVDAPTLHALVRTWAPHLTASGTDAAAALAPARQCIEYLRGAITASIFEQPSDNLLPHARALHVLETVLATHLSALQQAARGPVAI